MNEQVVIDLVLKLAECADLEEQMRLIQENPVLLSEEVDSVFETMWRRVEGKSELQQILLTYHHLLTACREKGIEAAFAEAQAEYENREPPPIVKHIFDFVDAPAWGISKKIVQQNPDLLSDDADAILLGLMKSYAGNEELVKKFKEHRELLQECRHLGIDAAFASRMDPGIDRQALTEILWQFFNTTPGEDEKKLIEQNPLLLDRYVDVLLAFFLKQIPADDRQSYQVIQDKHALLVACRTEGVEAAFEKRLETTRAADRQHSEAEEDSTKRTNQMIQLLIRPGLVTDVSQRITLYRGVLNMMPDNYAPDVRAALQTDLANHLLKFTGGSREENVAEAIALSKQALEVNTRAKNPRQWAVSATALASAYVANTREDASKNIDRGIRLYETALEAADPKRLAKLRVSILNSLAGAYAQRLKGGFGENIEKALEYMDEALQLVEPSESPYEWAVVMQAQANLFTLRVNGDKGGNIEKAIECYQQVIAKLPADEFPYEWAAAMNNLGKAYGERIRGDELENSEKEIQIYQQALIVTTREEMPREWAETMGNLAVAYIQRQRGDPAENIETAIDIFQQALEIRTREADPQGWANIKHNLSIAYQKRIKGDPAENHEQAIALLTEALQVNTLEDMPHEWEQAMSELALSYKDRKVGDRAENIEQAIAIYKQLLEVRSKTGDPFHWAMTKLNLAKTYEKRTQGDPLDTFFERIQCLDDALSVFTLEAMPEYHRVAQKMLGVVYFAMENWELAREAFTAALEAGERMYQASNTREARDLQLVDSRSLSAYAAYSHVKQVQRHEDPKLNEIALMLPVIELENGRTRALNETLGLDQAALHLATEEERNAIQPIREKIKALEIESRTVNQPGARDFLTISEKLGTARTELAAIVKQIRGHIPQFMPEGLDFPTMQQFIDRLVDPLIYLLTTSKGSLALVILPADRADSELGLPAIHPCWLDQFNSEHLHNLLYIAEDKPRYLLAASGANSQVLMPVLDEILPVINDGLMQPLASFVTSLGYNRAILIPTGTLSLLPLHAPVLDQLTLRFVPSAHSLYGVLQDTDSLNAPPKFVGIGALNSRGQKELPFSYSEVRSIADEFSLQNFPQSTLAGDQATFDETVKVLPGAAYLHFACHGKFDLKKPLNSRLFLSGEDSLTLQHLLDGSLDISKARLAVLSACQTGIIEYENLPDEAVGFPAGFIQAGVQGIISTLWPVSDFSTFLLLKEFYKNHLERKMEPAEALCHAQRWLRSSPAGQMNLAGELRRIYEESGESNTQAYGLMRYYKAHLDEVPFRHPYYWAPFVYTGI